MLGILSAKPAAASPNGLHHYMRQQRLVLCQYRFIKLVSRHFTWMQNRNALAVSAGFKIFIPVPPKTSLPIITVSSRPPASTRGHQWALLAESTCLKLKAFINNVF
jgi:hypothetical protein